MSINFFLHLAVPFKITPAPFFTLAIIWLGFGFGLNFDSELRLRLRPVRMQLHRKLSGRADKSSNRFGPVAKNLIRIRVESSVDNFLTLSALARSGSAEDENYIRFFHFEGLQPGKRRTETENEFRTLKS